MPLNAVFLSASVPDPRRHERYFSTGNTIAIRDAVIALVTVVLPRTNLVFGGHPAITPMVKWVADQLDQFSKVRMFQSKFFRDDYLKDIDRFGYIEIDEVPDDREKSLKKMRTVMINSDAFSAAFFIGGMDGVEKEYDLLVQDKPAVPLFPVYTTGAAARLLWPIERSRAADLGSRERLETLDQLRAKTSYTGLFTTILDRLETKP